MDIDIIIPLYKPDKTLFRLLDQLKRQTLPVHRIILMNTEEKYFERLIYGTRFTERYRNVEVYHLSKREFDHGKTRHIGVKKSQAEIFVMMTQDAMPQDEYLLEKLTAHLLQKEEPRIAVAYARQLPRESSGVLERFTRQFNYPEESRIKSAQDLKELGIKTYFCSNVCAAYARDLYEELGGFVRHTIFNEDMIYAAKAVTAGYRIAYEAQAQVVHSHNYTNLQQLRRNFDLGVSQAEHPEIFSGTPSEAEGGKLLKEATVYLCRSRNKRKLPHFYMQCICKYMGYLMGKHYRLLPRWLILKLTASREYWR